MAVYLSDNCRELITSQEAVLARWQVASSPRDLSAIDTLLRQDRWQSVYRGVYAAHNGALTRQSLLWAAVRRCGPGAAISYGTAAELDRIADRSGEAIHVAVPARDRIRFAPWEFSDSRPRIIVHRSARLDDTRHPAKTLPRTRVEETVLDLVDSADDFGQAFFWLSAACSRRVTTPELIRSATGLRPRLRWRADTRDALEDIAEGVTSNLERRYVRGVEKPHRLPAPLRQAKRRRGASSAYLDNLYADFGVGIELDGLAAHPADTRWEDIHRSNYLARSGILILRYNWADITQRPCEVAAEIAAVLRSRGWTGNIRLCSNSCRSASAHLT